MRSSFGKNIKVSIRGGSHEPAIGVDIEGLPIGTEIDMAALQSFMDRRAPGNSPFATKRKEPDIPVPISGLEGDDVLSVCSGKISFEIRNTDAHSADYKALGSIPRPGHADYTARLRYGDELNMAGGGPFSARMTAPLCIAGGIAKQVLASRGITIGAHIHSIADVNDKGFDPVEISAQELDELNKKVFPVLDESAGDAMKAKILAASEALDSVGGTVEVAVVGLPGGIGGAMYDGIESALAPILFGIPAVKGAEFGAGFNASEMLGSENNDSFYYDASGRVMTHTNNCGGVLGGITTGMPLIARIAFKPTPSIALEQDSVNLDTKENTKLVVKGRHDPCVVLRAVPVVEAAIAIGLLDCMMEKLDLGKLRNQIDDIDTQITDLFKQRMDIALDVARYKKENGLPVLNDKREKEILHKVSKQIGEPLDGYARQVFNTIFDVSKSYQNNFLDGKSDLTDENPSACTLHHNRETMRYGLVGRSLAHSYSKEIHESLGKYSYEPFDLEPDAVSAFIAARDFGGLNVTIPYKQDVMALCDEVSELAAAIGSVNTLYWKGQTLVGHNTDYEGFLYTAKRSNISFDGKVVLILGTGGTSLTARKAAADQGAAKIYVASRTDASGYITYEDLSSIASGIDVIVNTTPVGTFPNNLQTIIDIADFPKCEAVIDVVYNPFKTKLILDAEKAGLKTANGLPMLVAQATAAAGYFLGTPGAFESVNERIIERMIEDMRNIVLIGMPGCGKTTIGRRIADETGKRFIDMDDEIVKKAGKSILEIFEKNGESGFRDIESEIVLEFGKQRGLVIATGGGAVLRPDNIDALRQNGLIIHVKRPLEELAMDGRPLSKDMDALRKLEAERMPIYESIADTTIDNL